MSTVRFRYGFHPEGFDPLLALRSTQPAALALGSTFPATGLKGGTVARTLAELASAPPASPMRSGRPERAVPRRAGWGKVLWASVVLLSMGVAGTVWAVNGDSASGPTEAPVLAFAPPTVIEPEATSSSGPLAVVTTDVEPTAKAVVQPPATAQPSTPAPRTPASPPVTPEVPQPAVSPLPPVMPSVSLPPAVVWTPAPVSVEPSEPPVEDTPVRRPTVVVKPEVKPTIKAPPSTEPRPPAVRPKVRPGFGGAAAKVTRVSG